MTLWQDIREEVPGASDHEQKIDPRQPGHSARIVSGTQLARILGADDRKLTTEVIIPAALSWIIASLHISFGLALVGAVVGELFGATEGVGQLIYSAEHNFNANGVFAGMLLLATMALIAEAIITALEDRLVKWRPPQVGTEVQI